MNLLKNLFSEPCEDDDWIVVGTEEDEITLQKQWTSRKFKVHLTSGETRTITADLREIDYSQAGEARYIFKEYRDMRIVEGVNGEAPHVAYDEAVIHEVYTDFVKDIEIEGEEEPAWEDSVKVRIRHEYNPAKDESRDRYEVLEDGS